MRSFYGKKTQHCEIAIAVNQVEEEKPETADIVMMGLPPGGQENDLENENDDSMRVRGLPNKVSCKLEVFNVQNEDLSDDDDTNDDNFETTAPPTPKKAKKGKPHKAVKWEKKHFNLKPTSKPDQDKRAQALLLEHLENVELTVWSSFEKVFLDIASVLVEETNRYANRDKNKPEFNVTLDEMLNFLGLIFLSGNNIRLLEKDYWSIDPDLRCGAFPETMTRNRFFRLKSFLHTADDHSLRDSRMAKVEPLYNVLSQKFQAYGNSHEDLSIDESMVPYYGCHSCKQFICAKPIRFGYKLWVLASPTGLPYNVETNAGKSANDTGEPLGTRVVKNALEVCERPSNHSVYFDNFFSS